MLGLPRLRPVLTYACGGAVCTIEARYDFLVVKLRCEVAGFKDGLQSLLLLPLQNVLHLEPVSKLLDVLTSYDRVTPLKVF